MQNLIGGKLQPVMSGRTFDLVGPTTGIDQIRSFASAARVLEGPSAGEGMRGHTWMIRRGSIGVRAQVTPWSSPTMMAIWDRGRPIAADNTIVLDPAAPSARAAARIGRCTASGTTRASSA